jgi:hypothetical protein
VVRQLNPRKEKYPPVSLQLTCRLAYAEYLARTTASAVAVLKALTSVWSLPQHLAYPSVEPQGQSSIAAPPNPKVAGFVLEDDLDLFLPAKRQDVEADCLEGCSKKDCATWCWDKHSRNPRRVKELIDRRGSRVIWNFVLRDSIQMFLVRGFLLLRCGLC